jgi:hypothetical protein
VNAYYVHRYVARTHIMQAIARPTLAAVAAAAAIHFMPWLRLYAALPLAAVFYAAGLFVTRTFSTSELGQVRTLVRLGIARLRGSSAEAAASTDPL